MQNERAKDAHVPWRGQCWIRARLKRQLLIQEFYQDGLRSALCAGYASGDRDEQSYSNYYKHWEKNRLAHRAFLMYTGKSAPNSA